MTIQLRGDTAANWASNNPILPARQMGLETDTRKFKIGDGTTAWNSLLYWANGSVTSVAASGGTTGLSFTGSPITTSGILTLGGTLGVANGGTGTTTQFTAGSLVFAGASGVYSQDNANLSYDDATNILTIPKTVLTAPSGNLLTFNDQSTQNVYATITTGAGAAGSFNWDTNNGAAHTWKIAGAEQARLNTTGFGIGTSSPSSKLHVTASGNDNTAVFEYSAGSTTVKLLGNAASQQYIRFGDSVSYRGALTYDNATNFFAINTNSAERMRIDSSGNVGIGTSSPTQKLTVVGTVESTTGGFKFPDGTIQTTAVTPLGLWDYWKEIWFGGGNATTVAGSMFSGAVISTGTITTAPASAQAKGYNPVGNLIRSSTTANSGYKAVTNSLTAQYFGVISQKFRAMITPATAFTNNTIRAGWLNTITSTAPTTGAWLEMSTAGVWSAKCSAGGAVTTNATTYASTINVPLTLDVEVNAAGTSVRYRIYANQTTTPVLDVTNTTNIPTSFATGTGSGLVATNSGTTASDICVIHALMQGTPAGYNRARG